MGAVSRGAASPWPQFTCCSSGKDGFHGPQDIHLPAPTVLCDQNSNNFHKHGHLCFQTESSSCLAWDSAVQLLTQGPHRPGSPCLLGHCSSLALKHFCYSE